MASSNRSAMIGARLRVMTTPIKLDIWSDVICPWCYIGKRRLEAGIAQYQQSPDALLIEVEYHSFELSSDTPVDFDGSVADFLADRKGMSREQATQMLQHVTDTAASVGLDYHFEQVQHTNTLKAHELLHFASAHGKQSELQERLMRAYFTEGRHIGRDADLADLAADIGLDREEALHALANGTYGEAVRDDIRTAMQLGITGVPFFVIDGTFGISGAQPPEVFAEALAKAVADRTTA